MVALNVFRLQEFPLCCFKVIMICASELLNSDEMALMLLYVLVGATASLLLLVIVDRPYRDSQGHDGATDADKLQMLVLTSQLANYGVGWWCLTQQVSRAESEMEKNTETGSYLSETEELLVALASVLFVAGPLIPPAIHLYRKRRRRKQEQQSKDEQESAATFENPVSE